MMLFVFNLLKGLKFMIFLKNSDGQKSGSYTFAWISFFYGLIILTLSLVEELTIGAHNIKIRAIDPSTLLFLWGPSFSLYGYRRYVDQKFGTSKKE